MRSVIATLLLALAALVPALSAQNDVVMKAMKDELERSKTLHLAEAEKPYYIQYRVDDATLTTVEATLGALATSKQNRTRTLSVQVRAGNYALDNTNYLDVKGIRSAYGRMFQSHSLPLDDDYQALRRDLWLATDAAYKRATSDLAAKRSLLESRKNSAGLPDFTPQAAVSQLEPRRSAEFDQKTAEQVAREVSAVFRSMPEIVDSQVTIIMRDLYTRFLNSEGTAFTHSEPVVGVNVHATIRAADGFPLTDGFALYGSSRETLRSGDLVARARALAARLSALRNAASVERYNGPVLFEGPAAGQVLSDVFAPAIAATRFPLTSEPQFETAINQLFGQAGNAPLTDRLGGRVMPDFLDLTDQPRLENFQGVPLLGTRTMDEEGVPTHELHLVEGGILKTLLATRTPTADTKDSTGSKGPFGAQTSNLILTARQTQTAVQLRKRLLEMAHAHGYDFGIVVRGAGEAGLSWISRFAGTMGTASVPNTASLDIRKVYADGHEERVRGVEINSLTPASFRDIVAVGDKPEVYQGPHIPTMSAIFSGFGGSGLNGDNLAIGSFVAPAILFEEIALKKANVPTPNPPVAPSPLPAFLAK